MDNKPYLLPEESALAGEINFAIKKYDLTGYISKDLLKIMNESKDWIVDSDLMLAIELGIKQGIDMKNEKNIVYLRGLIERISFQKEIVANSKLPFLIQNVQPEKLIEIKSLSCPVINRNFHYRFMTNKEKYENFIALRNLAKSRPYLEKLQPYLNHMTNTHIPTKNNYHPRQIEFALPILFRIEQAKERGLSNESIEDAIDKLNNSRITSPEYFETILLEIEKSKTDISDIKKENILDNLSVEMKDTIKEVIKETQKAKIGIPLTDNQILIMSRAESPALAKEIGEIMSKGYVSNDMAEAILDNVNAISKQNPDVNYNHLTQTFSLVAQLSRISPKEMTVLGDLILNSNAELSFYNIRQIANEVKSIDVENRWTPSKSTSQKQDKKHELSFADR